MSEAEAGAQVASPTPTPRRTRNNCQKLRVRPDAAVIRLQKKTPAARIRDPVRAIRQAPQRHAHRRVQQREGGRQPPDLSVGQPPLFPDRLRQHAADLPIEEVDRVDREQDAQRIGRPRFDSSSIRLSLI